MSEIDFVFEGGGAKGQVFVGALQELYGTNRYTPGRLLGTSAGAITAVLAAVGYTPQEMLSALAEKDAAGKPVFAAFMGEPAPFDQAAVKASEIRKLLGELNISIVPDATEGRVDDWVASKLAEDPRGRHLFAFVERGGWFSADAFLAWLRQKLSTGQYDGQPRAFADMTMSQFHDATGREVTLVAADTTWQRMLLLNHRTAPQLPIVYGVRMSMSVPLLWEEVVWQAEWGPYNTWDPKLAQLSPNNMTGHQIVDGGLLSNFPIALFMASRPDVSAVVGETKTKNVLGLLIDETLPVPDRPPRPASSGMIDAVGGLTVIKRLQQLANTATSASDNMAKALFAANVVRLPAGGYSTTQFDMTDAEREVLIAAGRKAMRDFLATQTVLEAEGGEIDLSVSDAARAAANAAAGAILAP
ncbi:MAG: patatin-like phospholipase family protein [Nitrososphaerales archaeon]